MIVFYIIYICLIFELYWCKNYAKVMPIFYAFYFYFPFFILYRFLVASDSKCTNRLVIVRK